jgi:hypothetical protein
MISSGLLFEVKVRMGFLQKGCPGDSSQVVQFPKPQVLVSIFLFQDAITNLSTGKTQLLSKVFTSFILL